MSCKAITKRLHLSFTLACIYAQTHFLATKIFGYKYAKGAIRQLFLKYERVQGQLRVTKVFKNHKGFLFDYSLPNFPSRAFNRLLKNELELILNPNNDRPHNIAKIQITAEKAHFSNSKLLVKEELDQPASASQLTNLVKQLKAKGVNYIQFCGGEPLNRFSVLNDLIKQASPWATVWVATSGCGLDDKRIQLLKASGLTGLAITLTHYNEELHNQRVGNGNSFYWAQVAAKLGQKAGLAMAWHLKPHPAETTPEYISTVMNHAKEAGVQFVQFSDYSVSRNALPATQSLQQRQHNVLEDMFVQYNHQQDHCKWPTVSYPAYHQRRIGCFYHHRSLNYNYQLTLKSCAFCNSLGADVATVSQQKQQKPKEEVQYRAAFF